MFVCSALVLVRPNGHLLSPELGSSFGGGGGGVDGGGSGSVIRTGLYPRSSASAALHYAHSTPRVNAGDLTQPSLQAGQKFSFSNRVINERNKIIENSSLSACKRKLNYHPFYNRPRGCIYTSSIRPSLSYCQILFTFDVLQVQGQEPNFRILTFSIQILRTSVCKLSAIEVLWG